MLTAFASLDVLIPLFVTAAIFIIGLVILLGDELDW